MPATPPYRAQPWLPSPLRTPIGVIELAGRLQNASALDPVRMRVLPYYTLMLMVAGRGYYRDENGLEAELVPGDVVLVFPGVAHAYGAVAGGDWTQVYVVFSGALFDLWRSQGVWTPQRPLWRLGAVDYWQQRLHEVVAGEPRHAAGTPLRALGRFAQVLTEMLAAEVEHRLQPDRVGWLEEGLRLLGERGAGGWRAPQDVARAVGLSYENFRKKFRQQLGVSPGRFQNRKRLEAACAALYHGETSLKRIADAHGFCDVFHFSKAFKRELGVAPSTYRRRTRGR